MTPAKLIDLVASAFGLSASDVTSRSRRKYIVEARQAAAWVLRRAYPSMSLQEIGRLLGGRDHTTIGYSLAQIDERIAADPALRAQLHSLLPSSAPAPLRRRSLDRGSAWWLAQSRETWHVLAA